MKSIGKVIRTSNGSSVPFLSVRLTGSGRCECPFFETEIISNHFSGLCRVCVFVPNVVTSSRRRPFRMNCPILTAWNLESRHGLPAIWNMSPTGCGELRHPRATINDLYPAPNDWVFNCWRTVRTIFGSIGRWRRRRSTFTNDWSMTLNLLRVHVKRKCCSPASVLISSWINTTWSSPNMPSPNR